jgi:hypothetical protein
VGLPGLIAVLPGPGPLGARRVQGALGVREAAAGRIELRLGLLHHGFGVGQRPLGRGQAVAQVGLLPYRLTAGPGPVHHETIMSRGAMTRPDTLAVIRTPVLLYLHDKPGS